MICCFQETLCYTRADDGGLTWRGLRGISRDFRQGLLVPRASFGFQDSGRDCRKVFMRKCVFFDRDGIVNESPGPGYVERWEDFVLLPEFVDVLQTVTDMDFDAVIISNQRGIARGITDKGEVERIHDNLQRVLKEKHDLVLLDIIYCPHDRGQCTCRKPQPGMLQEASRRHDIDMSGSWMIGDQETDIEAGKSAGCRTVLVSKVDARSQADYKVGSMKELRGVVRRILGS